MHQMTSWFCSDVHHAGCNGCASASCCGSDMRVVGPCAVRAVSACWLARCCGWKCFLVKGIVDLLSQLTFAMARSYDDKMIAELQRACGMLDAHRHEKAWARHTNKEEREHSFKHRVSELWRASKWQYVKHASWGGCACTRPTHMCVKSSHSLSAAQQLAQSTAFLQSYHQQQAHNLPSHACNAPGRTRLFTTAWTIGRCD